jgi:TPR repeat protein
MAGEATVLRRADRAAVITVLALVSAAALGGCYRRPTAQELGYGFAATPKGASIDAPKGTSVPVASQVPLQPQNRPSPETASAAAPDLAAIYGALDKADYDRAARLSSDLADRGSPVAMVLLSSFYAEGRGVMKNCVISRMLLNKAKAVSSNGPEDAATHMPMVADRIRDLCGTDTR